MEKINFFLNFIIRLLVHFNGVKIAISLTQNISTYILIECPLFDYTKRALESSRKCMKRAKFPLKCFVVYDIKLAISNADLILHVPEQNVK